MSTSAVGVEQNTPLFHCHNTQAPSQLGINPAASSPLLPPAPLVRVARSPSPPVTISFPSSPAPYPPPKHQHNINQKDKYYLPSLLFPPHRPSITTPTPDPLHPSSHHPQLTIQSLPHPQLTMRFPTLALLSALAAKASADAMASYTECYFGSCSSSRAVWYTDFGHHKVDANEGCRKGASDMQEMCVDWRNGRGHFRFPNGPKRCFHLEKRIGQFLSGLSLLWG